MQIGKLSELCWPSLSPALPPIKLIKVGPIVSDGGLQVGRGEPGPGESLVPGMKCVSSLSSVSF